VKSLKPMTNDSHNITVFTSVNPSDAGASATAREESRGCLSCPCAIKAFFEIARVEQAFMPALKIICNLGFSLRGDKSETDD
jgi:hypothetical protein